MPIFDDDDGEVFEDPAEFISHILDHLKKGDFQVDDVVDALANMMGIKNNHTHDVVREIRFGFTMLDERELAQRIHSAWLHQLPWGVGLRLGIEDDHKLTPDQDEKLARITAALLTLGGLPSIAVDGKVRLRRDDTEVDITQAVNQFRQEIEQELGPDAPITGEGWDRWGL